MNNNLNDIPNTSDIKIEDTPAESFQNLYENNNQVQNQNSQQPIPNQMNNVGSQSMPNVNNQINPQSMMQPQLNQQIINNAGQNVQPAFTQTDNTAQINVQRPAIAQTPNQMANVTPQPMPNQMNNIGPKPMPNVNNQINPQPMMQPQPNQQINQNVNSNLSNIDIDNERMQSIEEQLSKTSQYNPEDLQQEKITIATDNQDDKNKSGLTFVIVLFIILAVVIALLPQITKWIS